MNNKVDDVLYKLVETKKFVAKVALNDNSNTSYENAIKGLHNIIVDYTMNNKMSRKEILDITFSLYDIDVEKTFLDKVKDFLNIPKHIKNTKEKIIENHKKKETKKQYEKEIESLVKDKLKEMIKQDKLDSQNKVNDKKGLDKEKQENINITNNKELSTNHNIKTSVPTSNKEFEETKQMKI